MRPLLQFLLLGVLLFAADRWLLGRDQDREPRRIEISSDRLAEIRRSALASSGRLPDDAELRALIDAEVAEEMVWVRERRPGGAIPLASVRNQVRDAPLTERGERALQRAIEELRDQYQVRVAAP